VPEAAIRDAARLYAQGPSMSFHGLGLTEHSQGTEGVMALINLALLAGHLGRPGTGVNPLRGQNNVQGAALMGCDPDLLTGSVAIEDRRDVFEQAWRSPLPRRRGMDLMTMIDAAAAGRLKARWVIGYDLLATLPELERARQALQRLECVIVQDLFLTETARAAGSIVLPVASVFEKDGTFVNAERRVQRVRKAVDAPPGVPADWQVVCALAQRMGCGDRFPYAGPQDIWDEIRRVWPGVAGISYGRIAAQGLQWPCRDDGDAGTPILHVGRFAHGRKAPLLRIDHVPTPERTCADFPLLLTTGRHLYQFNAGTMTMRTANAALRPSDTLDIAPADAARSGIGDGDRVHLESRHGATVMTARVSDAVKEGELFASFHDARVALNRVTGPRRDGVTGTPEYKVTAVRVSLAAPGAGERLALAQGVHEATN
jgi:formate dehydrogenase major subunit